MNTSNRLKSGNDADTEAKRVHAPGIYANGVPDITTSHSESLRESVADPIAVVRVTGDVFLELKAIVSDHDETISIGTGEHVHDGPVARFAQGLSLVLMEHHDKVGGSLLTPEQVTRHRHTSSLFTSDDWGPFKGQAGKSEDAVLQGMLEIAIERFNLAGRGVVPDVAEFKHAVNLVLEQEFPSLMAKVTVDEGITRFFEAAMGSGIPVAVCSASQPEFVHKALGHMGVEHLVHSVVGNAKKKTGSNTFDGQDIARACKEIGVEPGQAVMFGDSIGDVGAAALAGVGIVVICLREGEKVPTKQEAQAVLLGAVDATNGHPHAHFTRQVNSFQGQPRYYEELTGRGHPITVLVVDDFNQVKLGRKLTESKERASYLFAH